MTQQEIDAFIAQRFRAWINSIEWLRDNWSDTLSYFNDIPEYVEE